MQPYNQKPLYMQSSTLGNTPSNNTNLENIIHNNPNNPHKNQNGSVKKKLLAAGGILAAGALAYYFLTANPFVEMPEPTPYTPPAVTGQVANPPADTPLITIPTENTTETPKPKESLEDKLPDYAPLSAEQISEYTLTALRIAYEAHLAYEAKDSKLTKKLINLSDAWLDRALYALKISNFEEGRYLALKMAKDEYLFISISPEYKAKLTEWYKEDAAEAAKSLDKDSIIKVMKANLETVLGMAPGSRGSR